MTEPSPGRQVRMFGYVQEGFQMIRHAAAVVVALCLSTSPLYAQTIKLTVSTASANVHKAPSLGSPIIGQAPRGTALVVTREVGDWVKVTWPSADDGAGYVRTNVGTIASGTTAGAPTTARSASPASQTSAPIASSRVAQGPTVRPSAPSPARTLYVAPTHIVGVGATAGGSTMGYGASVRAWSSHTRLGAQLSVSRHTISSPFAVLQASSTDIAPSVLYSMRDSVSDYLWMRPYVGGGVNIGHSSMTDPLTGLALSSNTMGYRMFGGGELAFAALPKFSLSADIGYYHLPTPFVGYEVGGIGLAVSGHYYVK